MSILVLTWHDAVGADAALVVVAQDRPLPCGLAPPPHDVVGGQAGAVLAEGPHLPRAVGDAPLGATEPLHHLHLVAAVAFALKVRNGLVTRNLIDLFCFTINEQPVPYTSFAISALYFVVTFGISYPRGSAVGQLNHIKWGLGHFFALLAQTPE